MSIMAHGNGVISGAAPVSATDVYQALATAPSGVKPVPVKASGEAMVCLPVEVIVRSVDSACSVLKLPVEFFHVVPHLPAETNKDTGKHFPERRGHLRFVVKIPDGWHLVRDTPLALEIDLPGVHEELPAENPHARVIPELAGVDPGVFAANPERHSELMRELNSKKSAPPLGDN
jgi:hypothetical protein